MQNTTLSIMGETKRVISLTYFYRKIRVMREMMHSKLFTLKILKHVLKNFRLNFLSTPYEKVWKV